MEEKDNIELQLFEEELVPELMFEDGEGAAAQKDEVILAETLEIKNAPSVQQTAGEVSKDLATGLDESMLSEAERKQVTDFAKKIDIANASQVLKYGASAQGKIASFSDTALAKVRTKDMGEIGGMLNDLVGELKGFDASESKPGFLRIFKKGGLETMKAKYDKAEVNVDKVVKALEENQVQLLKDIAVLDKMYDMNLANTKELAMYIMAGQKKLDETRSTVLVEMERKAKETSLPEDSQAYHDMVSFCDRFEKKLHDLTLTRMVAIQMAPQIRLVQNNDTLMTEKIQSTIVNTIPLWKSQMVIALGLEHSRQAVAAQRAVTDMTNKLLRKNAENLKQGTIDVARESERSLIDIETLQYTNEQLITTLDEVMTIQNEGKQKRRDAEHELRKIELDLKNKLLSLRSEIQDHEKRLEQ